MGFSFEPLVEVLTVGVELCAPERLAAKAVCWVAAGVVWVVVVGVVGAGAVGLAGFTGLVGLVTKATACLAGVTGLAGVGAGDGVTTGAGSLQVLDTVIQGPQTGAP